MKKLSNLLAPLLFAAALCAPAFAQTEETTGTLSSDNPELSGETAPQARTGGDGEGTPAPQKKKAAKKARTAPRSLDDINPNDTGGGDEAAAKAAKKTAKKPAKKKKPAKPVSEYKFSAADSVPTYKFDKKANPIVKDAKKKKPAKKGAAAKDKKGTQPALKLKPSKPIGAEDKAQDPLQGMMQGAMQGAGGNE